MEIQYLVAMLVCITALASYVNYRFFKLPKSIGLTVITLGLSIILMILLSIGQAWVTPLKNYLGGINFSSTVMDGMLSYLLFANALHINSFDLSEHKKVVATLATASVFISCLLIGTGVWFIAPWIGLHISYVYCLVFGALIASTDPICVINAMKRTKTPKPIRMKIIGESLFNDAASIVLFVLILQIANSTTMQVNFTQMVLMLIQQGAGGIILGVILGKITAYFMTEVNTDETVILMTLALVTGGYSISLFLDVSGPICMVIAGLVVGNHCRNPSFSQSTVFRLYSFWNLVDDMLNSFLFAMIGLEILSIKTGWLPILVGVIAFFMIVVVRIVSVTAPILVLEPVKNFNWRVLTVMTWGGMRGGLSIALALSIPEHDHKDTLVAITYAVVVISIILQGLTIQPLIKKLYPTSPKMPNQGC